MKVSKLITMLQEIGQDREVILSRDAEGNGYSPLQEIETGMYRAEARWCGEFGLETLTPELREKGYTEEDIISNGEKAVVLYPIN